MKGENEVYPSGIGTLRLFARPSVTVIGMSELTMIEVPEPPRRKVIMVPWAETECCSTSWRPNKVCFSRRSCISDS